MPLYTYFYESLIHRKGGLRLFQTLQKETFLILYNKQVLLGIISRCKSPFLHHPKEAFLPPLVWSRREYTDDKLKTY